MKDLRRKIGQLFIAGIACTKLKDDERRLIEEYNLGGVIFFKRNYSGLDQLIDLVNGIKSLDTDPPILSVDQEGGQVIRFGAPFTQFPGNYHLGKAYEKTGKADLTAEYARITARELKSCGLNLCFAPVIDILTNPQNRVIAKRAFSQRAEIVAELGAVVIREFKREGMLSCVKHFPGHGDTVIDSHEDLPIVGYGIEHLKARELIPFKRALEEDVPLVMTSHILYKSLDPKHPVTLSKRVLSGLLRKTMGYGGTIIADDFDMNAVSKRYDIAKACVLALKAGVNMILLCRSTGKLGAIIDEICAKANDNSSLRKNIEESFKRVGELKKGRGFDRGRVSKQRARGFFDDAFSAGIVNRIKSYD